MSEVIVVMNARWRVTDDLRQWIVEVRKGQQRDKASGWAGRRFHLQRTALIRSVQELCAPLEPEALEALRSLPAQHPSCG